ncbi:MAG: class I SAM-dependent methyltransferase [Candidatus Omnitrophota bacterium]
MKEMIKSGLRAARAEMSKEDKIWSRYSNDKVDIGETLAKVIRTLTRALPLSRDLRALSIGSSDEPQFRILETMFRGGLYLLDIEKSALDIVRERVHRQYTDHVRAVVGDYRKLFLRQGNAEAFLKTELAGQRVDLITLHHSLYYLDETQWLSLFENLFGTLLAPKGAVHAVLMSSESENPCSTTWLYNHFAGKFFGHRNDQNLLRFKRKLHKNPSFRNTQVLSRTSLVKCFVNDFEKLMEVVWMILLYPNVHPYSLKQREEITEHIYKKFWKKKRPLLQQQDHLAVYRGINFKGLI